ncbi:NADPH oxidase organizer 1-like [Syngnathoides biaculeatus]|uniref:NADPH oxidase organizer 1-like n=1 Tax=Syngnathoides biaculeatus TaxID=300417 RepID=UPI002ADD633A|nr:NADPH oxidase organizer 1-like [Syngnathoides biaculeatus]
MPAEKRFVFSARIISAVQRETPKLKTFMVSVLWSDENEVIVYRSYDDFKNFHRQLKKKFPHFSPSQDDRIIPKFKGEAQTNGLQQRGSKRCIQRMKDLESYCNKLLMCDQMVTCSSEVTQFFTPLDHDMDQDFTKNSAMILLSDISLGLEGGIGGGVGGEGDFSVTRPFVTETYRCVAAYETKDTNNRPFKAALDEALEVLIKDPAGWWLVENEDKCIAWFPAPYLEKEKNDERAYHREGALYCAVRNYFTKKADEISVPIGSVVEVLRMSDDGWWLTRYNGKVGYVPSMYLQPYNNPRTGLFLLQNRLNRTTLNQTISGVPLDGSSSSSSDHIVRETHAGQRSAVQPRAQSSGRGYLAKARSMELLSQTRTQTATPARVEVNNTHPDSLARSISTSSNTESTVSSFSSSLSRSRADVSRPSLRQSVIPSERGYEQRRNSTSSFLSYTSSGSSGSSSSRGSDTGMFAPLMPPRPKKEEILNRCSTMTRKAAAETKARLQIRPDFTIHTRL